MTRAPAAAARRLPRRVRSARAGVPGAAVRAALARGDWQCERALPTVSDTAVIMVYKPGGETGTLKMAATGNGAASLRREYEVLGRLGSDERLGRWRELLPVPICWEEIGGGGFLLTSRLPGRDSRRLPPGGSGGLTAAAFDAIAPLHRHSRAAADVDAALLRRWLEQPAEQVREVVRSGRAVDQVAAAVRAGLAGRRVALGWAHGDFHPGNVLAGPDGQVTGIVDWDQAGEPDLGAVDLAFWLLTEPAARRREFGARVAARLRAPRCWTPAESRLLGDPADGDPAAGRALLLLTWLRHIAGNLAKSGRYARSPLWLHRNVRPVLRQVADG
jgi:Phosphotransferase enzyme family